LNMKNPQRQFWVQNDTKHCIYSKHELLHKSWLRSSRIVAFTIDELIIELV
jgi:hypothetical protein